MITDREKEAAKRATYFGSGASWGSDLDNL